MKEWYHATNNGRLIGIDAIRGIAVLLMIVDRVATAAFIHDRSAWAWLVHQTFGRLTMPLFFILMGAWYDRAGWSPRRWGTIAACGMIVSLIGSTMRFDRFDVLLQISVLVLIVPFRSWRITVAVLGFLQAVNWPIAN